MPDTVLPVHWRKPDRKWLFLAESVQFHTLDNVLQVFHRFYYRAGKPVGNDYCCGKKSSNNSQKDLQHFVCRGKDHRFRLDSQISVACICGIQSGDVFFLICDGTLYGKGILVRISKFVIFWNIIGIVGCDIIRIDKIAGLIENIDTGSISVIFFS